MAVIIAGRQFWLWRAVDDEVEVPDLLVQRRRDKAATVKLICKLLKKQGFAPDALVTDKLRLYGAAKSEIGLSARHEQGLRQNNRAGNSHQLTRGRERKMQRFKSPGSMQRCLRSRRRPQHVQRPAPLSHPAARSASCETKRSGRGDPPPRPEGAACLPFEHLEADNVPPQHASNGKCRSGIDSTRQCCSTDAEAPSAPWQAGGVSIGKLGRSLATSRGSSARTAAPE
jgi:hypothetical protein